MKVLYDLFVIKGSGDKPVISQAFMSLLLTLELGFCPQSHVITMISYSCLWYNYNLTNTESGSDPDIL